MYGKPVLPNDPEHHRALRVRATRWPVRLLHGQQAREIVTHPEKYYVNAQTSRCPAGAIPGQLGHDATNTALLGSAT